MFLIPFRTGNTQTLLMTIFSGEKKCFSRCYLKVLGDITDIFSFNSPIIYGKSDIELCFVGLCGKSNEIDATIHEKGLQNLKKKVFTGMASLSIISRKEMFALRPTIYHNWHQKSPTNKNK